MKLKIELTASKAAMDAALGKLASPALRRKMVESAALELQSMSERTFNSPTFRPTDWAELEESTKRTKRRLKLSSKKLQAHGVLKRSLSASAILADDTAASFDDGTTYGVYHQYGTRHMPARPFVPVTGAFGAEATPTPVALKNMVKVMKDVIAAEVPDFVS